MHLNLLRVKIKNNVVILTAMTQRYPHCNMIQFRKLLKIKKLKSIIEHIINY